MILPKRFEVFNFSKREVMHGKDKYLTEKPLALRENCCFFTPCTPGVNFINILGATFLPIFGHQKIAKPNVIGEKLSNLLLYKKRMCKMLMKLTPDLERFNFWIEFFITSAKHFYDSWPTKETIGLSVSTVTNLLIATPTIKHKALLFSVKGLSKRLRKLAIKMKFSRLGLTILITINCD